MKNIVIIGAGGFAKEVKWLIERINAVDFQWRFLGFVDNIADGEDVVGDDAWLLNQQEEIYAVCAIGNAQLRKRIVEKFTGKENICFPNLIDPSVIFKRDAVIGEGTIICAGSILTVGIHIGSHVIINLDSTVGHNAILEDYVTIYPSVNVSGDVVIGHETEIGTGTKIIQGIKIGSNTVIGAGAVVTREIPPLCTAVGAPAKPIKFHK